MRPWASPTAAAAEDRRRRAENVRNSLHTFNSCLLRILAIPSVLIRVHQWLTTFNWKTILLSFAV